MELVLDIIVLMDIVVTFFTDNVSDLGKKATNRAIAFQYVKTYFFMDLLSSLPGLLVLEDPEKERNMYWLKLLRFLQLPRTFNQITVLLQTLLQSQKKHILENSLKIFRLNVTFILLFHIGACVWIYIGINQPHDENNESWYTKEMIKYEG
jgi:hypothetical protein